MKVEAKKMNRESAVVSVLPSDKEARCKRQRGASLVEYALLAGLIAVVAIAGIRVLGTKVSEQFSSVGAQL